jgi:hypothetical protein
MFESDSVGSSSSVKSQEIIDAQARRIQELERALALRNKVYARSAKSNGSQSSISSQDLAI